ncbi:hypothetical protein FOXB_10982 [Fusarium oxysporum f. sp. conglutinans Fo5176]|uniref:Uncharacterized protein n=1 Tax=Fusarium oxysporum (strain Fo5176) TaxID=660025 RepID=F9FX50_FUSOF|nr:hypothetical protein FOXB_10982 [Fusarium oxysporum f. sp. conglutinans Fo5176]
MEACFKNEDSEVFSLVDATRLRIVSPTLLNPLDESSLLKRSFSVKAGGAFVSLGFRERINLSDKALL